MESKLEWTIKYRKYPRCSGCYSFYLVEKKDHKLVHVIVNLHLIGTAAHIEQLFSTKISAKGDFVANHEAFYDLLREMKVENVYAHMIPEAADALEKHSVADMRLLDTEFDPESGLELTNIEINLNGQ